jgi:hypothetical protein
MARDPDLRPIAGVLFGLFLVFLMYAGIWWLATQPNRFIDWVDPQPTLEEQAYGQMPDM